MNPTFHLSLSVTNVESSRRFYQGVCGAEVGRVRQNWTDVWLFGAQITLYQRPEGVVPLPYRHGQHFGATISIESWRALERSLVEQAVNFAMRPAYSTERRVAKMVLEDPDGYLIEIKAYDDPAAALCSPLKT